MSFAGLLLIALAVSADAFAVALTMGVKMRTFAWRYVLTIALVFGGFQALMPLIGWFLGDNFLQYMEAIDHWIAFGLLLAVGGHMLWAAFRPEEEECVLCAGECGCDNVLGEVGTADPTGVGVKTQDTTVDESTIGSQSVAAGRGATAQDTVVRTETAYPKLAIGTLLMLGVAESIDALAVGITFPVAGVNVWAGIALIGVVTTLLSALAVWLGHKLGTKFSQVAEILGGSILIAIGIQVLIQHIG